MPSERWLPNLYRFKIDPSAVVFFEGSPIGGLNNSDIVRRSWNFDEINARYETYLKFLASGEPGVVDATGIEERFAKWFRRESDLWRSVYELDPLLPRSLWPRKYLGERALSERKQAYGVWGSRFAT